MTTSENVNSKQKQEQEYKFKPDEVIDNSALETAIKNYEESQTEINKQFLIESLLNSSLIIPININGTLTKVDNKILSIDKETQIFFALLTNQNNEHYCPLFTNNAEYKKLKPNPSGSIKQSFLTVTKSILESEDIKGVVINPFGQSLLLPKEILKNIYNIALKNPVQKAKNYTVSQNEKVLIGDINNFPKEALQTIKQALKQHHCVEKAYLRLMIRPSAPQDNNKSYLLIIDSHDDDVDHLFTDIAQLVYPYVKNIPMDFLKYKSNSSFIISAIKGCKPIYKKSFLDRIRNK
ncbi:MAG: enhanced serine sensitivity protein SseB C-terminal domain-containing protein [Succinivibrionaceae bacterium]